MDKFFLNNSSKKSILLFFSGWSVDYKLFVKLNSEKYDIIFFYNYKNDEIDNTTLKLIKSYSKVYIVAWSMGVFMANFISEKYNLKIDRAVAINGSIRPVDNEYGIPEHIFEATLTNLNERNLIKFYKRMCSRNEIFEYFAEYVNVSNIEDYKLQLIFLRDLSKTYSKIRNIFDIAYISTLDAIFPPQNLIRFWGNDNNVKTMELPHFVFHKFNSFDDFLNL